MSVSVPANWRIFCVRDDVAAAAEVTSKSRVVVLPSFDSHAECAVKLRALRDAQSPLFLPIYHTNISTAYLSPPRKVMLMFVCLLACEKIIQKVVDGFSRNLRNG